LRPFLVITTTHPNHYRSFAERLPMIKFTITDDKNNDYREQNPYLPKTARINDFDEIYA
jgi:hypothetical protein